jgi:hypothetical protein
MQSFKSFVAEQNKPVEQGKVANGVPCAVVNWRRKSATQSVPAALIDWSHAPERLSEKHDSAHAGGHYGDISDWHDEYDNDHIGHGGEVHDHLVKHDKGDEHDNSVVNDYTRDSSGLNRHLYNSHVDGEKHKENAGGINVKAMDKAVGKTKLKHDLHTYSGVTFNPGKLAKQHPEGHLHLPAFTSTSIDKETAHGFATGDENEEKHVIHFHLKKGQAMKYAEPHSENPGEHEVILPRNTTWKLHPRPDTYEDNFGDPTKVWHAHPVETTK